MTEDSENGRWDTPCGVHHGYVFLSGMCAGLTIAAIVVWVVVVL